MYYPVKTVSSKFLFDPCWKICQQNELKFEGEMQKICMLGLVKHAENILVWKIEGNSATDDNC